VNNSDNADNSTRNAERTTVKKYHCDAIRELDKKGKEAAGFYYHCFKVD